MKKTKCLLCGGMIDISNNPTSCPHCQNSINYDLVTKTNKIELLKHDALMYIINNEYNKLLIFIDNNHNNLLLEYYRMYSYISLNKQYDKTKFYNNSLKYTDDELETIINHMIEHQYMFIKEDILQVINKSKNKNKYISILDKQQDEKVKEKELREKLFIKTKIPEAKETDFTKQEGISYIIIGSIIYIAFFLIVLIFTNKDLKYSLLNLLSIIPSILITRGIVRLYINKNKILFSILIFIGLLFIITLPGLIFSEKYNILTHIIGIIKSPIEFFTILAEGMKSYEE